MVMSPQFSTVSVVVLAICLTQIASCHSQRVIPNLAGVANKTCDRDVLDKCGSTVMVFGKRSVYLPVNQAEMVPHCQEEFDAEDCIKNFARRCLSPFERQVTGLLILGAGQVMRKRCSTNGTKEYLTHYRCLKTVINGLHDTMEQLTNSLTLISNEKNTDDKIPMSCCAFARFQEYSNRVVKHTCQSFDTTAEEYIGTKMIKGYSSEVLDLACPNYDFNGDKCNKVKVPSGGWELKDNKMMKTKDSKFTGKTVESIVLPFINIFTRL